MTTNPMTTNPFVTGKKKIVGIGTKQQEMHLTVIPGMYTRPGICFLPAATPCYKVYRDTLRPGWIRKGERIVGVWRVWPALVGLIVPTDGGFKVYDFSPEEDMPLALQAFAERNIIFENGREALEYLR